MREPEPQVSLGVIQNFADKELEIVNYLFTFVSAMVLSIAIIPLMIRLAPRLGMVDYPDQRKVHTSPITRAGGIGIVLGTLVPVLLWVSIDAAVRSYILGSVVLLAFGMWDDSRTLSASVKFVGQFAAAIIVVYAGNTFVSTLPFMNLHQLAPAIAKPLTVFALVGIINAMNLSDGLDGLAGGLSILSLSCIAFLASQANGTVAVVTAIATMGGILGFMRYNTYPAKVFMGDGGSQFLGFTLGFLTVFLLQKINTALSPALPVLILGLPVTDIMTVIAQRIYFRISPFQATKHHVHHHLLALGLDHYEAVVVIYSVQTLLVILAVLMRYDADGAILLVYASICAVLLLIIYLLRRRGRPIRRDQARSRLARIIYAVRKHPLFVAIPVRLVGVGVPILFIMVSLGCAKVPRDLAIGALTLASLMLLNVALYRIEQSGILRVITYVTAAFIVYLETRYLWKGESLIGFAETGYFIVLALAIALAVRFASETTFKTTPMDYLVVLMVLSVGALSQGKVQNIDLGTMAIKLVIVFYGCELIISQMKSRWNLLNVSSFAALVVLGARGFGLG